VRAKAKGAWLCAAVMAVAPAAAEVVAASPGHFEVTHRAEVAASPAQVYAVLTQLPKWWNPQHSWSGDTANMSVDPRAGGCWCERWGDGASAQHARVRQVIPGRLVLMEATLGPLIGLPVSGLFTMVTSQNDGKTAVRLSYRVTSAPEVGLDQIAPAVDRVLGDQFLRLKTMIETGRPPN
jgi:uncharacterized protein YndB with AHSA1/START domain